MTKSTGTDQSLSSKNKAAVLGAADNIAAGLQDAVLDRLEEKMFDFFLGGGLQLQLAERLTPILAEFGKSVGLDSSSESTKSVSLIGGDSIDVTARDV